MTKKTIVIVLAAALGVAGGLSSCSDSGSSLAPPPLPPGDMGGVK